MIRREWFRVNVPLPFGRSNTQQVNDLVFSVAKASAKLGADGWDIVGSTAEWMPGDAVPSVVLTIEREEAIKDAAAAEREACAKVAEQYEAALEHWQDTHICGEIAAKIRARGLAEPPDGGAASNP